MWEGNGGEKYSEQCPNSLPFIRDQTGIANGVLDQHSEPRCIDPRLTVAAV